MEIDYLTICDAANVRERMLSTLSSGITRILRTTLPAPLGVQMAVMVQFSEDELDESHVVEARIVSPSGLEILRLPATLQVPRPPRLEPGELLDTPIIFDVRQLVVGEYGRHEASARSATQEVIKAFWVLHPEEMLLPPL